MQSSVILLGKLMCLPNGPTNNLEIWLSQACVWKNNFRLHRFEILSSIRQDTFTFIYLYMYVGYAQCVSAFELEGDLHVGEIVPLRYPTLCSERNLHTCTVYYIEESLETWQQTYPQIHRQLLTSLKIQLKPNVHVSVLCLNTCLTDVKQYDMSNDQLKRQLSIICVHVHSQSVNCPVKLKWSHEKCSFFVYIYVYD